MSSNQQKPSSFEFPNKSDVMTLSNAQNKFARDLYLNLIKSQSGNLFFSPFSISAVMAMGHLGTGGNTEQEVKNVLHFPEDKKSIERAYHDLISDYKIVNQHYQFNAGHMTYVHNGFDVLESYISTIQNAFFSMTKAVDFERDHKTISQEINEIVEKETKSKIKNLIPPGVLNPLTRMVLVNYVYFKGNWVHPFRDAEEKPFWVRPDSSINVPMMTLQEAFRIANLEELDARLLIMGYQGERMNFAILLPNERDGLTALEEKLPDVNLSDMEKKATMEGANITIPKFKLEESMDLVKTLQLMGINDLFLESKCNLSGMAEQKGIYVSNILHKAFLDVNEKGTEAAAATAMIIRTRGLCLRAPPTIFLADHPFIFYIRDKVSDSILFMGRCTNPKSGGA